MGRHKKVGSFAKYFLQPRFRALRLVVFSAVAVVVFLSLWSLSGHPLTNKNVLSDTEIDYLYRKCHAPSQDVIAEPHLAVFIPFDSSQIDLVKMKLSLLLEPGFCPCNLSDPGQDARRTDLIFFFLGDPQKHKNLLAQLLASLDKFGRRQGKNVVTRSVRKCFHRILFKSLRNLDLPTEITIADLFYGVIESDLLKGYTHMVWLDVSVSPLRNNWVNQLHTVLRTEPFWVLGAMTSSRRHDHYERGQYHMHMNAIYRIGDRCFTDFLDRVKEDYRKTTPDLAIHLYRTDYANFREAQHTQHLFRYSRMFIALDLPMTIRPQVDHKDWPGTYFVIQDRHYEMFGKNKIVAKKQEKLVEVVQEEVAEDMQEKEKEDGDDENVVENEVKKQEEKYIRE